MLLCMLISRRLNNMGYSDRMYEEALVSLREENDKLEKTVASLEKLINSFINEYEYSKRGKKKK